MDEKNSLKGNSSHMQPPVIPAVVNNSNGEGGDKYYCPMHCEGDKTYDKPGDCPVCGMHLVKQISGEHKEIKKYTSIPYPKLPTIKVAYIIALCTARAIRRMISPAIAPCAE
ncbi:MAG: heavy metal-binding domain-containing protein [Chitinophagaceae bacterium]